MNARIRVGRTDVRVDLSEPVSLAIDLGFSGTEPRHFGAPYANARPFSVPGFSGSVVTGASCNCQVITLIPHCNSTHTECVAHLTRQPMDVHRIIPTGLLGARLVSVTPEKPRRGGETTDPQPEADDRLITRRALEAQWPTSGPFDATALIIRTLPNGLDKRTRDYTNENPPYLTREAAELLVARGIEHLVIDTPSIDRAHDQGRLTAHRIFFGLPAGSQDLSRARRQTCTVTEMAYIPDSVRDDWYLLQIQTPALGGDAVPSRPLLFSLLST